MSAVQSLSFIQRYGLYTSWYISEIKGLLFHLSMRWSLCKTKTTDKNVNRPPRIADTIITVLLFKRDKCKELISNSLPIVKFNAQVKAHAHVTLDISCSGRSSAPESLTSSQSSLQHPLQQNSSGSSSPYPGQRISRRRSASTFHETLSFRECSPRDDEQSLCRNWREFTRKRGSSFHEERRRNRNAS